MAYCTEANLIDRYGEQMIVHLTDRAMPATGQIDPEVVAAAIGDTDAMIDGFLAGRYRLPLAAVPPLLQDLAEVIAIYKLHAAAPDPKIEADYRDALKLLRDMATGLVRLVGVGGVEPPASGGTGVMTNDRQRPFTEENLRGFI